MARLLGIDYGERRIGLALSDPLAMIAQPLPTLTRRRGKRPPYTDLLAIIDANEVAEVVIGLPLTPQGDESDWTREVREFGDGLRKRVDVELHYVDERMTSARAERAVRSLGLRKAEREDKGRIDAAAATLILQAHLDARGAGGES